MLLCPSPDPATLDSPRVKCLTSQHQQLQVCFCLYTLSLFRALPISWVAAFLSQVQSPIFTRLTIPFISVSKAGGTSVRIKGTDGGMAWC